MISFFLTTRGRLDYLPVQVIFYGKDFGVVEIGGVPVNGEVVQERSVERAVSGWT